MVQGFSNGQVKCVVGAGSGQEPSEREGLRVQDGGVYYVRWAEVERRCELLSERRKGGEGVFFGLKECRVQMFVKGTKIKGRKKEGGGNR
ncbi:hypothetical protein E2C01_064128 [Portunus trituberculatus]|uniref:Uncharacterized protein n=1 Tax=Portunus trituberculatus TaxID=210409 RepID=A0A5B7HIX3_PORTR|nr:hypothetical protein [Portunus trituberculatus]